MRPGHRGIFAGSSRSSPSANNVVKPTQKLEDHLLKAATPVSTVTYSTAPRTNQTQPHASVNTLTGIPGSTQKRKPTVIIKTIKALTPVSAQSSSSSTHPASDVITEDSDEEEPSNRTPQDVVSEVKNAVFESYYGTLGNAGLSTSETTRTNSCLHSVLTSDIHCLSCMSKVLTQIILVVLSFL